MSSGHRGEASLRARRESQGLSIEQVSADLKIPATALESLEAGRLDALPDGPFAKGWLRAYREHLGLDPDTGADPDAGDPSDDAPEPARAARDDASPPPPPNNALPLWAVRLIAGAMVITLLGLAGKSLWSRVDPPGPQSRSDAPDQMVTITAERAVRVRVRVDDGDVQDRVLTPGEKMEVAGRERVEVDLPAVEAARIVYNGEVILPQGRQDEARRLVFIDDVGAR